MDFNLILKRVLGILTKPAKEWEIIKGESTSIKDLYLNFACIVFAIPSVFIFLSMLLHGGFRGFFSNLLLTVFSYMFILGGVFLSGVLIDIIAPQFGASKDMLNSHKLAVYSLVPFALAGFLFLFFLGGFSIFAWIWPVLVFGLPYAIYLIFIGTPILKSISNDKLTPFIAIVGAMFFIVFYIMFLLSFKIYWQVMWGSAEREGLRALEELQKALGK